MSKEDKLHEITKELVKQMTGLDVTDPQEGDYQIAYYYLNEAINSMSSCTELKCDCGNTEDVKNIPTCASCYNPNTGEW